MRGRGREGDCERYKVEEKMIGRSREKKRKGGEGG